MDYRPGRSRVMLRVAMRKLVLGSLSALLLGVAIAAAPEQSPVVAYQFAKASTHFS